MTRIEEMLRDALHETPSPLLVGDPLGELDRRVRRARRRIAIGTAVAVAAIVAAVAVPLSLSGGGGRQGLQIAQLPTPSASSTPRASDHLTPVIATGAVSVSSSGAQAPYVLIDDASGSTVGMIADDRVVNNVTVQQPAQRVLADADVAWVIGNDSTGHYRITAAYPAVGETASTVIAGHILDATVASGALYVLANHPAQGTVVDSYVQFPAHDLGITHWSPAPGATGIATDGQGDAWLQTPSKLIRVHPTGSRFQLGPTVPWPGGNPIYGPAPPEALWSYDGRLIGLSPANLAVGVSVAEGWRLNVSGRPGNVVSDPDGGVYYTVPSPTLDSGDFRGVFYYSAAAMQRGASKPVAHLSSAGVTGLAVDPQGGVDILRYGGALQRWHPRTR